MVRPRGAGHPCLLGPVAVRAANGRPGAHAGRRRAGERAREGNDRSRVVHRDRRVGCACQSVRIPTTTSHLRGGDHYGTRDDQGFHPSHERSRDPCGHRRAGLDCRHGSSGHSNGRRDGPYRPGDRRGRSVPARPPRLPSRKNSWPPAFPVVRRARQLPSRHASGPSHLTYPHAECLASACAQRECTILCHSAHPFGPFPPHDGYHAPRRELFVFRLWLRLRRRAAPRRLLR
jgi:hypothetical protein